MSVAPLNGHDYVTRLYGAIKKLLLLLLLLLLYRPPPNLICLNSIVNEQPGSTVSAASPEFPGWRDMTACGCLTVAEISALASNRI